MNFQESHGKSGKLNMYATEKADSQKGMCGYMKPVYSPDSAGNVFLISLTAHDVRGTLTFLPS